ncbi:TPA: hypothetical protein CPT88_09290 [Candidatus Gastranaerophilales bacterium HUM_8]|nr:MAG TPA: hypothetical protein CPT88_09290 [Candidatus Gastranaerophilales bacterium HUM_8]DAB03083.1 MAG TPA: hypothetical protein CPT89_04295 [Candidatus Gastranaerophilales bacterium HUM_11]
MINVCLACDDNYAKYAGVVIASILDSANLDDSLCFYILDGGIKSKNKDKILALKDIKDCEIKFVPIDNSLFTDYMDVRTHEYISIPTFYRLKLPTLLPNVKRVIYFDCDFVVTSSLAKLFNVNMGDYPIAGVKDISKKLTKINPNYVNAGMLVMDIENLRKINAEKILLDWTKEHFDTIKLGDQEIINEALKGKIMLVEDEWNVQSSNFTNRSSYTRTPKAIHFVAKKKPWHYASFSVHRPLYFKYLQLTPWKLSEKDLKHWTHDNQIASLIEYVKYRPLFLFRPRFYEALFETYIKPCFEYKKPVIKSKTFIVWEPCSKSHSEVVPGYVKYLLDLGYHVSVIVNPQHYKSGLFSRFEDKNLTLNKMSRKEVKEFFRKNNLKDVSGVLVTTSGKLCDSIHYEQCYESFNPEADKSKLFFVEHEVKHSVDAGTWRKDIITLRKLNYKEADSVVVNPHYFGEVKLTPKNSDIVNFVTVGAIQGKKKNNDLIINSVKELHEKGIRNFKITVIGKGHLKKLPKELQQYFDIKGRLPFDKMYDEIEKADFLITSYDETKPGHIRYNTTGTSGNFQLVYGFAKPCIIIESFGPINGFDSSNSILYKTDSEFANALQKGIEMSSEKYSELQKNLKAYADKLYENSKENLRKLITTKGGINE